MIITLWIVVILFVIFLRIVANRKDKEMGNAKSLGVYHGAPKVGIGLPPKGGVIGGVPQSKGVPGPMAPVAPVKGLKKMTMKRGAKKAMC